MASLYAQGSVVSVRALLLGERIDLKGLEAAHKPDVLWERPGLNRLFSRLEDEYELAERRLALDRKLDLIARTVETAPRPGSGRPATRPACRRPAARPRAGRGRWRRTLEQRFPGRRRRAASAGAPPRT